MFCVFFGLHSSSRSRTNCQSCDQLKIKFSKFAHKDTQNPTQNQEVSFYKLRTNLQQPKQSKATRTRTRTRKLWTWPKSHTHINTPKSKTQHQNASGFVFGRKNPSLKLDHLSKSFCLYGKNKSNPSCKNPNSFSSSFFFSFWVFFVFFFPNKFFWVQKISIWNANFVEKEWTNIKSPLSPLCPQSINQTKQNKTKQTNQKY